MFKKISALLALVVIIPIVHASGKILDVLPSQSSVLGKATQLVKIKGGCFQMGSDLESSYTNEKPRHKVCLKSYYIGKTEVSVGLWKAIMGRAPKQAQQCGDTCAVTYVNWNEVNNFIQALNIKTGKKYRLPTEAEWEYAARSGGKKERWSGTNDEKEMASYAWEGGYSSRIRPIGQKKPNGLGIYDMSGNAIEWVNDWYYKHYYERSPINNPTGHKYGEWKTVRGDKAMTTTREGHSPNQAYGNLGFRLAL